MRNEENPLETYFPVLEANSLTSSTSDAEIPSMANAELDSPSASASAERSAASAEGMALTASAEEVTGASAEAVMAAPARDVSGEVGAFEGRRAAPAEGELMPESDEEEPGNWEMTKEKTLVRARN